MTVLLIVASAVAVETTTVTDDDSRVSDSDLWIHCELLRVVTDCYGL